MSEPLTQGGGNLRDELQTFGFSDTEIDTYLAVLSHGETTTRVVSEEADVTQRAVYNIVERLEDRGVVRVNDHASPTTIRALPPDDAIANLEDRLEAIQPRLEERFNETERRAPEVQMVKTRETALKRLENAIASAEKEIAIAISVSVYSEIKAALQAAMERGILVFLLLGDLDDEDTDTYDFEGVADVVRYWDESHPFLYVVDDRKGMMGDAGILAGTHVDETAAFVDQEHLAGSLYGIYLGSYWPASSELYVADPDSLPKSFEWFRTAVFQATVHERNGADLRAEVETESGESFSGRIGEIRQPFVTPTTNDFALETSFTLETGDGIVSFGGPGSFLEDYEAADVTLHRDD